MVSDVSADIEKAAKATPPKGPETPPAPPPPPTTPPVVPPSASGGNSNYSPPEKSGPSGLGWVIAGVVVLVIWIANSGSGNRTSTPSPRSPEPTYSSQTPATAPASAPVTDTQKPAVGRNQVLGVAQIRYCKTEKIRIEAFENVINNAYDHEVDRFNGIVNDYNSRCGEFRYRRGDVERIERELAPMVASITSAAKSEWVRGSLGLQSPSKASTAKAAPAPQRAKPKQNTSCQSDGECPGSLYCVRGKCGPQVGDGGACDRSTECAGASQCVAGQCVGIDNPAPSSWQPTPAPRPVEPKPRSGMPANAELDYTGRNWKCKHGYRRSGDECVAVQMPANAEIDYTGQNWKCRHGYRPAGGQCVAVQMPANAEIDYTGQNWKCRHGYRPVGGQCEAVQMPPNAEIDYTGQSWKCRHGYLQSGNACLPL